MIYAVQQLSARIKVPMLFAVICIALAALYLRGQETSSANAPGVPSADILPGVPKYEVATIKPAAGKDDNTMLRFTPSGVSMVGLPMQMLLREAFRTEDDRIVGAPGWVKSSRYDIEAKVAAEDAPKLEKLKIEERRSMLVSLLVERYNLKYHHETRELPSYSLVVAKGGLKMKESKPDDPAAAKEGNGQHRMMFAGRGHLESTGTGMQFLVHVLSQQLGRSIVDKTGLSGNYDYTLQWTPDDAPPPMAGGDGGPPHGENAEDAGGPPLLTAIQEQLGLKLEAGKGQADVIVIDHIDQPSAN